MITCSKKPIFLLLVVLMMNSVPVVVQGENTVEKIVAKVDYGVITLSELMEASAPSVQQIRDTFPPEEWDKRIKDVQRHILMQMINEHVCIRFARENEIPITDEEIDTAIQNVRDSAGFDDDEVFKMQLAREGMTLDELRDTFRRQTAVRKVLRNQVYSKVRVTEKEIKDYWEANADQYSTQAKIRIAVLMLDDESWGLSNSTASGEKAEQIYLELQSGSDFAGLVKEYSDGPAKDNGGDIGFLEKGTVLPVIEQTAFDLEVDAFSKPLKTDYGWVIVKVLEKEAAGVEKLSDVRAAIENQIRGQKAKDMENEWFEKQRAKTFVQILEY